ncbi:MAG: sugar phosphate isomerase/epimerase [Clostridia bacterium]|nr:sugar phosphate isomerase/epimerase [Clostridia bacterium]
MIKYGLVSVSFRQLSCEEIISLVKQSELDAIEWGGDIHVPHGDFEKAKYVASLMKNANLETSAYGSYYRVGTYGKDYKEEFQKVLHTAVLLGAPVIRIWAGTEGSDTISSEKRAEITAECVEIADMAKKEGVSVAFECHRYTLTDDYNSSLKLMEEMNRDNLKMFWQPNEGKSFEYNLEALKALLPYIKNVHVFNWPQPKVRLPLKDGEKEWKEYFKILHSDTKEHFCSLEFMPDDSPKSLITEAQAMKNFI